MFQFLLTGLKKIVPYRFDSLSKENSSDEPYCYVNLSSKSTREIMDDLQPIQDDPCLMQMNHFKEKDSSLATLNQMESEQHASKIKIQPSHQALHTVGLDQDEDENKRVEKILKNYRKWRNASGLCGISLQNIDEPTSGTPYQEKCLHRNQGEAIPSPSASLQCEQNRIDCTELKSTTHTALTYGALLDEFIQESHVFHCSKIKYKNSLFNWQDGDEWQESRLLPPETQQRISNAMQYYQDQIKQVMSQSENDLAVKMSLNQPFSFFQGGWERSRLYKIYLYIIDPFYSSLQKKSYDIEEAWMSLNELDKALGSLKQVYNEGSYRRGLITVRTELAHTLGHCQVLRAKDSKRVKNLVYQLLRELRTLNTSCYYSVHNQDISFPLIHLQ